MTQLRINELLEKANFLLDKGFHIGPGYVVIKSSPMEALLDRIDASIPEDIKEAEIILRRRDEIVTEAQNRADRIIADSQNEASRVLSESELLRAVQIEAQKIRDQVIEDCEAVKRKALDDADNVRVQAADEAMKIREGAENYAERVLGNLENDLVQLQQVVQNGQNYLEKMKAEAYSGVATGYSRSSQAYEDDYSNEGR